MSGPINETVTYTYKYEDPTFPDLLTEWNGQKLTYDAIGNPLTYRDGMTMSWKHGRSLSVVRTGGARTAAYSYNGDGLRTQKKLANDDTVVYHIIDGTYVGETATLGGKTYHTLYLRDDKGSVIGLQSNGDTYYFARNLQGDVIAIYDSSKAVVAKYLYDAWGKLISVTDASGNEITDLTHIAIRNPFRILAILSLYLQIYLKIHSYMSRGQMI